MNGHLYMKMEVWTGNHDLTTSPTGNFRKEFEKQGFYILQLERSASPITTSISKKTESGISFFLSEGSSVRNVIVNYASGGVYLSSLSSSFVYILKKIYFIGEIAP